MIRLSTLSAALNLALSCAGAVCIGYSIQRVPVPVGAAQAGFAANGTPVTRQTLMAVPLPYSAAAMVAGGVLLMSAAVNHERSGVRGDDYLEALDLLISNLWDGATDTVHVFRKSKESPMMNRAKRLLVRYLPTPLKKRAEVMIENQTANRDTFLKFLSLPHQWVAGMTGAGKTFIWLYLLGLWLEEHPTSTVRICDTAYGKPDRTTEIPFYWNGYPQQAIAVQVEEIYEAIRVAAEEVKQRESYCANLVNTGQTNQVVRFDWYVLLIVEWNTVAVELARYENRLNGKKGKPDPTACECIEWIELILTRGNALRVKLCFDGQMVAVGESFVSEALRKQFALLLLGTNTCSTDDVSKFKSGNTNELVGRCQEIRNTKSNGKPLRPGIVQLGEGVPQAIIIPDLSEVRDYRFEVDAGLPADPLEQEWQRIYTPDKQALVEQIALEHEDGSLNLPSGSGGPLKAKVLPLLGLKMHDPLRPRASEAWEAAKAKAKQTLTAK